VVVRLHVSPFKPKTQVRSRSWLPFIFSLYTCISIVFIGVQLRAHKRTRVAVVEFHVSISDFCLTFLSSMQDTCVNIMTWIAYIVLKGRKTPIPPQNLDEGSRIYALFHYITFTVFHSFIPGSEPATFFLQWVVTPMGLELQLSKWPDL